MDSGRLKGAGSQFPVQCQFVRGGLIDFPTETCCKHFQARRLLPRCRLAFQDAVCASFAENPKVGGEIGPGLGFQPSSVYQFCEDSNAGRFFQTWLRADEVHAGGGCPGPH